MDSKSSFRKMVSRANMDRIEVLASLKPGEQMPGCCVCCRAPSCCSVCSALPCCDDAEYVTLKREASKYIYVRENSIEWNDPQIVISNGNCCGIDPCVYDVQDQVKVLYYDDPSFERITDKTRCCNETRTCLFGGKGELIQIDSPCCNDLCYRASFPCFFAPVCFPTSCVSSASRYEIYTSDAQKGMYEIKKARSAALRSEIFTNTDATLLNPTSNM